jgi:adenylate cyclase class 1
MTALNADEIKNIVAENKKKFSAYNSAKIHSVREALNDSETINIFDFIPFLFTVNLPEFPGYIKELEVPHGIYNYVMPAKLASGLRMTNPSFSMQNAPRPDPVIKLVALIGSAGTIAFTPDSDLDFWICGNFSSMESDAVSLLRRKCSIIEKWAIETRGREVHFYLNDIDQVKKNIFDEDEEYGLSGTSLGQMLKEEFYRSSIIVNDVVPFWWVVPADCSDEQYSKWLKVAGDSENSKDYVDLGNLAGINKGNFLIAALFQIIKSLGNPFKSLIKLGLLERYINDEKLNPFISNLIKKNVQAGETERIKTDAYCIMFDQVYDYYRLHSNDMTSINIIKTCFYLKVNPRLSEPPGKEPGEEELRKVMQLYTKKWSWDDGVIKHVDNFESWDIESTNRMMNNTKKIILKGYKNILSALGSEINSGAIGRESLLGINRKILSHFSSEDKKIDNTLNFKKYPPEKLLSLDYVRDVKGNETWFLNKRVIYGNRLQKVLIRKSSHLLSLIVWISLNGLYQKDYTRLDIEQGFYNMDPNYLRDLIPELTANFSIKSLDLHNSYFLRDPFPLMSYIIINPFHKYSNRIDEIYFLYHNSWGETRFEVYTSANELPGIAARIATGAIISGMDEINSLDITSSEPFSGTREFSTLKATFKNMLRFFTVSRPSVKLRFFTMMGNRFTLFSNKVKRGDNSAVSFNQFSSEPQMLYSVSYSRGIVNLSKVDDRVPELDYLEQIFSYDSDDSVKIFFNKGKKFSRFFVLNEKGSLFFFRKRSEFFDDYLYRLILFAESAVSHVKENDQRSNLTEKGGEIKAFKIDIDPSGKGGVSDFNYLKDAVFQSYREKNMPVVLSLHILDSGDVGYRFTLPDGMNSEIFTRDEVESVSREIASLMESIPEYSFFPAAVNLDYAEISMYSSSTSFAFSEKNRFELLIEKNLGMI